MANVKNILNNDSKWFEKSGKKDFLVANLSALMYSFFGSIQKNCESFLGQTKLSSSKLFKANTLVVVTLVLLFGVNEVKGQIATLELGTTSYTSNTTGAVTFTSKDTNLASLPAVTLTTGQQGQAGGAGYISSKSWSTATSVDTSMYYQFTLTAATNYTIAITQLSFKLYRSASGPATIALASDADSYATLIGGGGQTLASAAYTTITFPSLTITGKSSVTFRLYAYNASGTGTLRIGDATASSPDITVTGSVTAASPTIATTGTLAAVNTTYGTASATPTSFNVSGTNMTAGISVKPPVGFEVSTSSTFASGIGTNASPITVGTSGTIASTPVYVRLAATTTVASYSGNIVLSSASATNVNVATTASTVSTKALTISGAAVTTKTFDSTANATITGTLVGVVNGDSVTLNGTGTFASSAVGTGIAVTSTSTLSGAGASNYSLTQPTGLTGTIIAATSPTIGGGTTTAAFSTTYGTASAAQSFAISGNNLTDNIIATAPTGFEISKDNSSFGTSLTFTQSAGSASGTIYARLLATAPAGSYNTTNIVLSSTGASSVNITTPSSGNTVAPKNLMVLGLNGVSKVYDRTTTATFTGTASYSGFVNGDSFAVSGTPVAAFATATVGTAKTVTITGYTSSSANYTITSPTVSANITPVALTISSASVTSKIYDGTNSATITGTLTGILSPDVVTLNGTGTFASSAVGTGIAVTSTATLSGADAGNYSLTQPSGLTGTIILGPSTLVAGDIAIIAINAANPDTFSFVLLKDIGSGTVINFTDNGFTTTTTGTTSEGVLTFTAPTALPFGTVLTWTNGMSITGTGWSSSAPSNFALNASGDQLFAFQGTGTSAAWGTQTGITVLYGVNFGTALITTGSAAAATTYQPSTSVLPSTAFLNLASSSNANGYFSNTGSASTSVSACGSASTILSYLVNSAKWYGNSANPATFPSYTFTTACPPSIASTGTLAAFTTTYGTASAIQTISVSGGALTADVIATAPVGYEVSFNGTSWNSTATLTQTAGAVSGTLSIRLAATATVSGNYNSKNIILSSTGATSVNITSAASGNVVSPLALTISGLSGVSKIYDGSTSAAATGTAAYSGLVNGDSFTVSGTPVALFNDKNVGSGKTISITGFTAPSSNYTITQPTTTADITAKEVTVSNIVANDKVYDGDYPTTVTATLDGVIAPDNVTLSSSAAFTDGPYIGNFGVTATFSLNGTDIANYSLVQPDTSSLYANITPKPLTISNPTASNKVYDGTTNATISGTLVGVVTTSGEVVTLNGSYGTFASANIGSNIVVTPTWMIDGDTYNYTLVEPSVTLTANITSPGSPVITSSLVASANYGDSSSYYAITTDIAATTYSATGLPDGLNINIATGEITGTPTTAGTFDVTLSANGIGGTGYATLVYTIAPITLTVSGASANNKEYDGNTSATINGTLVGVINADDVSFNGIGTFDSAGVASNIAVTSNATLTGTKASNYILTNPTGLVANITTKTLTIAASVADKVYDRTNSASVTIASINGVIGTDNVTATIAGTFNTVTVGNNIPVTVTTLSLGGLNSGNYTVSSPTLTGNITQKTVTVTATANNKSFDGTTAATINVSATTGVITPDIVTVSGGGTFASSAIGTGISVTPSLVLGGADAANYVLTEPIGLTANIVTPPTTLAAGDLAIIAVNSANPDKFSFVLLKDISAGTAINFTDNGFTTTTTGTTSEGVLTFTAPTALTFGTVLTWTNGMSITGTGWSSSAPSNFALNGSGDQLYAFQGTPTAAAWGTQTGITVLYGVNYGAALITTGSASASTTYQPSTSILPTTAFLNLGTSTNANGYFSNTGSSSTSVGVCGTPATILASIVTPSKWLGTSATAATFPTYTFTTPCPTPVITGTATTASFSTTYGTASTAQTFAVTGSNLTANITATAPPGFEVSTNGTTWGPTATFTQASGSVNGTLSIRLSASAVVGGSYDNQVITLTTTGATTINITTFSVTVTPKTISISGILVNNKVQNIGDFTATLSGTPVLTGVLTTDTANVTLGGTAVASFTQDTYGTNIPVVVTGYSISGSAAANYSLVQPSVTGTITLVASPVITSNLTFSSAYGTVASTYAITATSDASYPVTAYNATGLPTGLTVNTSTGEINGTPTASPGNYTVTLSVTNDGGTTIGYLTYTITAKVVTVSGATAASKVYNGTTAASIIGYSLNGIYGTDVVTASGTGTFDNKNIGTGKSVIATLSLSGADAAKYSVTQPTGLTADITPLALTLSGVAAQNKVYDGTTTATINASLVGVISGDAVTFNGTGNFASSGIAQGIAVTSTATLSGTDAGNYSFVQPTGLTANITDQIIYVNTFTGVSACPTNGNVPTMATNATGTAVTRSTITCNSTANVFNSTTISTSSSLNPASYIEFSVTAATGYKLNLTSMSFFRQASNSAPNQLEVRYSTNGFSTYNTWGAAPNSPTTGAATTWDFADFSTAMSGTVTFRIYPYGTQRADNTGTASATGTFRIDDVTVYGTVDLATPPTASVLSGTATICTGASSNLNVAITNGTSPYTLVYYNGTSNVTVNNYVNGANISVTPSATTTYTLVSVTDANGLTSSNISGSAIITVNGLYPFYIDADGDGYGTGSVITLCAVNAATPPAGYSTNNLDCNDAVYSITNTCSSIVNLKLNIQGYYDTDAHAMRPVMMNEGVGSSATDVDDITVELRDSSTSELVATTTARLQTDGTAVATFGSAPSGSFYIAVKHRNSIQTWSTNPQTVGSTPLTYDFTSAANKAYGDNMIELESGVYGFYSGDVTQDEFIDLFDYTPWETDYNESSAGYYATDLNGDGFVDLFDYTIWETNYNGSVVASHPSN